MPLRLPHLPRSRETFAVFIQPAPDCPLAPPAGVAADECGIGAWREGQSFGEFSERTFDGYYASSAGGQAG